MLNETTNGVADEQSSNIPAFPSGDVRCEFPPASIAALSESPREKETSQRARDTDICSIPVNSFLPSKTDAAMDPSLNFRAW
jgi:hypothetical protein